MHLAESAFVIAALFMSCAAAFSSPFVPCKEYMLHEIDNMISNIYDPVKSKYFPPSVSACVLTIIAKRPSDKAAPMEVSKELSDATARAERIELCKLSPVLHCGESGIGYDAISEGTSVRDSIIFEKVSPEDEGISLEDESSKEYAL